MPDTGHKLSPGGQRPLAIIGMLLASLMLMGVLGWQSWQLQQSNDAAARSVLREYGILVADEYGRRLTNELGYRGYYPLMTQIRNQRTAEDMANTVEHNVELGDTGKLAAGFFVFDDTGLHTENIERTPPLSRAIAQVQASSADNDDPFRALDVGPDEHQLIYAHRQTSTGFDSVYGFAVAPAGIASFMQRAFDAGPLLPPLLASGRVGNDLLFIEVRNPSGDVLFEANRQFDSNLAVSKRLGDDYQGILDGFAIRVSLDPGSASALVIGGLPSSRLPLLFAVMSVILIMMLSAIWLFRREHAVMHLRSDFVSQVSHELRTPLTQIRLFAETLLLERARTKEESRRCLEIIDRESRRLSHLVENILRFSNISDTTRIDRHPQPLAPIIRDVCDTLQANASGSTIRMSGDESTEANIDADALHQVLLNVIDNAIKYGPDQQQITVALGAYGEAALISVDDQGPGIPANERARVWDAFYRLTREEDTAISGTGIGLAVVRELVEAMDGRCWIGSADRGTRVNIELPR